MQKSVCDERESYQRHFTDVVDGFSDSQNKLQCTDNVNKLRRRPKCKTRNKFTDIQASESWHSAISFALPNSALVTPSLTDGSPADTGQRELAKVQTDVFVPMSDALPVFDVLCSSLQCSENITSHQAAALSRWLSRRQVIKSANSSLMPILMASKCPLVSLVCCRVLKQLRLMPSITSCMFLQNTESSLAVVDVVSYVLFLQREMVKFLDTGQLSISLLNVICLLDCITATCRDIPAYCNKLHVYSRFCSHWSSSELRWAVLTVISLANVVSAKVKLMSATSRAVDAVSSITARSIQLQVERVPQIASIMLTTSVQCEVARASNIFRILNEYWHTTDFGQRNLIVDSVLVPKLRMELTIMILARYCDVLLRERFASSLSLDDIFDIFGENVVVSAIAEQVWINKDHSSVISHCREICLILCNAVCSYMLHQKGEAVVKMEEKLQLLSLVIVHCRANN